jgi:hypothetical protein
MKKIILSAYSHSGSWYLATHAQAFEKGKNTFR